MRHGPLLTVCVFFGMNLSSASMKRLAWLIPDITMISSTMATMPRTCAGASSLERGSPAWGNIVVVVLPFGCICARTTGAHAQKSYVYVGSTTCMLLPLYSSAIA